MDIKERLKLIPYESVVGFDDDHRFYLNFGVFKF